MNVLILSQSFKKYQETIGVINIRLSILIIATDDKIILIIFLKIIPTLL